MLPAIPTPIPMPFAQNGERRAIPETNTTPGSADASWATGFPPVTRINKQAGGKPSYGLDFQGLFHTICEHLFFSQSGNTVPWVGAGEGQPGLNYLKGAIVQGSDGETYMALKPSGPDAPNPDGTGFVGPVDPVGDESGHWMNLNLLYGGMPNSEKWITESGTWEAQVTGWHEVLLINGGQGSYLRTAPSEACRSGASGAYETVLMYLTQGQEVSVSIGAGGLKVVENQDGPKYIGDLGEATYFNGHTPQHNTSVGVASIVNYTNSTHFEVTVFGGGFGGGGAEQTFGITYDGVFWGGGGGIYYHKGQSVPYVMGNGKQGAVCARWHDPARAAGPLPEPALFAARSMAIRAAAPAAVNLYDPETGQGSVWRVEDAEAKLAEWLVTQEAWLAICAQKAAKERETWLADPETEAKRFDMLRAARDAKLAATDYLVAPDYPLTDEQRVGVTAYRQALRDLPAQEGAPWDGGGGLTPWPEMPAVSKAQVQE